MNKEHAQLCPSPEWAAVMQNEILPTLAAGVDLGTEMVEIGPGPGAATEWLRQRVGRLTAVEIERPAAELLATKYAGTNVEIVVGDASALEFADASFDSAGTFTMLHHIPTFELQNTVLAEIFRVLRPGGVLIGSDSLASDGLHHFHNADTYNPIEPSAFLTRLQMLGFRKITLIVDYGLMFIAHKPAEPTAEAAASTEPTEPTA